MLNLYRCMYINLNLHLLSCRLIQLVHWTVHFIGLLLHLCVVGSHLQNRMAAKTSRISKVPRSHPVCGAVASVSRLFVIKVVCFKCSDLLQRCFKWEVIKEGNFQINTLPPQNKSMILWIYLGLHLSCGLVLLFFGKGPHSPHDPVTSSDSFALNGSLAPVPRLLQAGRPSEFITVWW